MRAIDSGVISPRGTNVRRTVALPALAGNAAYIVGGGVSDGVNPVQVEIAGHATGVNFAIFIKQPALSGGTLWQSPTFFGTPMLAAITGRRLYTGVLPAGMVIVAAQSVGAAITAGTVLAIVTQAGRTPNLATLPQFEAPSQSQTVTTAMLDANACWVAPKGQPYGGVESLQVAGLYDQPGSGSPVYVRAQNGVYVSGSIVAPTPILFLVALAAIPGADGILNTTTFRPAGPTVIGVLDIGGQNSTATNRGGQEVEVLLPANAAGWAVGLTSGAANALLQMDGAASSFASVGINGAWDVNTPPFTITATGATPR